MKNKTTNLRIIGIVVTSFILTLVFENRIGKPIEKFESGIYQKISGKKPQHFQPDSLGIPVVVYEGDIGKQYDVVTVAEEALKSSKSDNLDISEKFFNCIKWLKEKGTILNDSSIIYLDYYDWPGYKMTSPWRSAMNQGRAMQAFIKAYEKTGDTMYVNWARRSMNTLYTEVKDGGVTYKDDNGYWYEEYADDNVPQSRVLNGMIVVLQALSDFYKVTKDQGALFLFNQGVTSVKITLHLYDNKGHSNYDILGKPAKAWYHKFHIELLDFLYNETHDPVFNEYKQKWLLYKEPSYLAALIQKPTRIGVFAVFTMFVGVLFFVSMLSYFIWFRKAL